MNGAEALLRTAVAAGVEVCFANPGTTELPLVAALDSAPGMRAVLALFEGVCTGAADGYARMLDRPALTLTHLGPGFGNGLANLHNARRARSAVVNLIGDQATWHLHADAPLTSDIESLARPVSAWVHKSTDAAQLGRNMAEAIAAAGGLPGRIATLIVPSDCQWNPAPGPHIPLPAPELPLAPEAALRKGAGLLRTLGSRAMLLLGGPALRPHPLRLAAQVAAKTGCRLMAEPFPARMERGAGLPVVPRLPYFPEHVLEALARVEALLLVGTRSPVAYFGYPNAPSSLVPKACAVHMLASPDQRVVPALEALVSETDAGASLARVAELTLPPRPRGELNPASIGAALANLLPEGCILSDEAATTGFAFNSLGINAPAHTYLTITGGAIGQGIPCATGAAIACPERKVISFQADGSGMYTLQGLWTQAREQLNVTTLLCNNRRYRILQVELERAGINEPGPQGRALTSLASPEINWASLAQGFGLPAVRVETADALMVELKRALATPGPNFIEMLI